MKVRIYCQRYKGQDLRTGLFFCPTMPDAIENWKIVAIDVEMPEDKDLWPADYEVQTNESTVVEGE